MSTYVSRFDWPSWEYPSRRALIAWLAFYAIFLAYVFVSDGAFLFIDYLNLAVHEGAHLFLLWYCPYVRLHGPTVAVWGAPLLQWAVSTVLVAYFYFKRSMTGFALSLFFFFENWLYTASYMVNARFPFLVSVGDTRYVEHDWYTIFSTLGILRYNLPIAACVRYFGRVGMLGSVALLVYGWWESTRPVPDPWLIEPSLQ
jgi:hypothetical protein